MFRAEEQVKHKTSRERHIKLSLIFDVEDGGYIFFRNAGLSPNYKVFEVTGVCTRGVTNKGNAVTVTGREGPQVCETSRPLQFV
jgi:hypothetical protein